MIRDSPAWGEESNYVAACQAIGISLQKVLLLAVRSQ